MFRMLRQRPLAANLFRADPHRKAWNLSPAFRVLEVRRRNYRAGAGVAMYRTHFTALLLLWMTACAHGPQSAPSWSPITVMRAREENRLGQRVHWGGDIVNITPGERSTCFEVISHPLARSGRPRDGEESGGRFIACAPGVYPAGLYKGQQLTVVGLLQKPTVEKIGEVSPRVAAEKLYFWPHQEYGSPRPTQDSPPFGEPWQSGSEGYWW
jgi:outer membrane lipoprotein